MIYYDKSFGFFLVKEGWGVNWGKSSLVLSLSGDSKYTYKGSDKEINIFFRLE